MGKSDAERCGGLIRGNDAFFPREGQEDFQSRRYWWAMQGNVVQRGSFLDVTSRAVVDGGGGVVYYVPWVDCSVVMVLVSATSKRITQFVENEAMLARPTPLSRPSQIQDDTGVSSYSDLESGGGRLLYPMQPKSGDERGKVVECRH